MQKLFISLILGVWFVLTAAGQADQPARQQLPNELLQYIRDARKAGVNEKQIQQNAVNAGWPADMVGSAIDSIVRGGAPKTAAPGTAETVAAKPSEPAPGAVATDAPVVKVNEAPSGTAAPAPTPAPGSGTPKPAEAAVAPPTAAPADKPAEEGGTPKTPKVVDRSVPDDYEIGAGDELQISVWKEPDASVPMVQVRPDGKITMPMLKEVSVIGLTPTQAEKVITEQLTKFISTADVTVIVKAINSKKIYVVGGVKKEGPIPYTYRMTILQALSEAGGLTDYAKRKKIYVLRHENGRDYRYDFDYDAVLRGEKMELNRPLFPGDTLVVPK